ncbi:MAG: hypothetical protein H6581_16640 [Bacteroidia bacterium]|nr:hypothetical protein [Bacteroidia bacterium]
MTIKDLLTRINELGREVKIALIHSNGNLQLNISRAFNAQVEYYEFELNEDYLEVWHRQRQTEPDHVFIYAYGLVSVKMSREVYEMVMG